MTKNSSSKFMLMLSCLFFVMCKTSHKQITDLKIIGGESAAIFGDESNTKALLKMQILKSVVRVSRVGAIGISRCSGTLIARNFVLTAAHCLSDGKTTSSKGTISFDGESMTPEFSGDPNKLFQVPFSKTDFIVHKGYIGVPQNKDDIALIKITREIPPFYEPMNLTLPSALVEKFLVAGYGITLTRLTGLAMSPVISEFESISDGSEIRLFHPKSGACDGDSGGATFALDQSGTKIKSLVGVTVRANCGDVADKDSGIKKNGIGSFFTTIFTDVRNKDTAQWIEDAKMSLVGQ